MSKKVTKPTKEYRQYETGDPVLGKVRGYPPWPGVVVDPADAPPAVLNEQPPGKKATFYCVLFFPMGDYAWLHAKDLSTLKRHEIEGFLADETKKRNGDLREGYKIALDPEPWMTDRQGEAQARREAEESAQFDQLDQSEGEADDASGTKKAKPSTSKKRKREADEPAKPKKAPKEKAPKKEKADKDNNEKEKGTVDPAGKRKAASRAKKNGVKSKATVESEDEGDGVDQDEDDADPDAGPSKRKASSPPAKRAKRDKDDDGDDAKSDDPQSLKVRDWRHKLQKTFLSNKSLPKTESMAEIDALFTTVETYTDMTIEQLQFSKIGKVMRHIAALSEAKVPPRDDEFKFRLRAKGLVDKWHQILNANKLVGGAGAGAGGAAGAGIGSPMEGEGESAGRKANGHAKKHAKEKVEGEGEGEDEDEMEKKTKGIDLNGSGARTESPAGADGDGDGDVDVDADAPGEAAMGEDAEHEAEQDRDAPAEADVSALADVTMSEADA